MVKLLDKLKIFGPEPKCLFVKLLYIGKYFARIKNDFMKIFKKISQIANNYKSLMYYRLV